jgi:hypothetical protein
MNVRIAVAVGLVIALGACSQGRDFLRPSAEAPILGETTRADVIAQYGEPDQQPQRVAPATTTPGGAQVPDTPGTTARLTYTYYTREFPFVDGVFVRAVSFEFSNDTLVAYAFFSDFDVDSSNFDETKAALLKAGETSKSEATRLLGPPSGRAIYPELPGREKYVYAYGTEIRIDKAMELLFGSDDKLIEYRVMSATEPRAVRPWLSPSEAEYAALAVELSFRVLVFLLEHPPHKK